MTHVAVVARSRSTLRALVSASQEAGYPTEVPIEPVAWSRRPGPRASILVLRDGGGWEMLSALAAAPAGHYVLAVLENASTDRYIDALRMHAHGVADADREPQDIVAELTHVLAGTPRIPYPALRRAVAHAPVTPPFVPPEEVQVLEWLVEGLTVDEMKLRRVEGKRQTERLLRGLLRRFHATNRYAALIQAERWGLLDGVVTPGTDQPEAR